MSNKKHWEVLGFKAKEEYEEFHNRTRQDIINDAQEENRTYNPDEDEWIIEHLAMLDEFEQKAFESVKQRIILKDRKTEPMSLKNELHLTLKSMLRSHNHRGD